MSQAGWSLTVEDFRVLRKIQWSPSGVCLLAGPNGAGKSTLLQTLRSCEMQPSGESRKR